MDITVAKAKTAIEKYLLPVKSWEKEKDRTVLSAACKQYEIDTELDDFLMQSELCASYSFRLLETMWQQPWEDLSTSEQQAVVEAGTRRAQAALEETMKAEENWKRMMQRHGHKLRDLTEKSIRKLRVKVGLEEEDMSQEQAAERMSSTEERGTTSSTKLDSEEIVSKEVVAQEVIKEILTKDIVAKAVSRQQYYGLSKTERGIPLSKKRKDMKGDTEFGYTHERHPIDRKIKLFGTPDIETSRSEYEETSVKKRKGMDGKKIVNATESKTVNKKRKREESPDIVNASESEYEDHVASKKRKRAETPGIVNTSESEYEDKPTANKRKRTSQPKAKVPQKKTNRNK